VSYRSPPNASIVEEIIWPPRTIEVLHHKTALSLASTENISLAEALRLISSSPPYSTGSPSSDLPDPRFDFINFPYLSRQRPSPTSDLDISLFNRFSPLSNLPISKDPSLSLISKPYSSAAKNFNSNSTYLHNRPQFAPRSNLTSGYSSPPASVSRHSYPKAHRNLLLDRTGALLPLQQITPPPYSLNLFSKNLMFHLLTQTLT